MSFVFALAIYFICWWLVLFMVLPWGVRTQDEDGHIAPGTPASAPVLPHLGRKMIATTIIATVIFGVIYVVIVHKVVTLDDFPLLPRFEDLSGES